MGVGVLRGTLLCGLSLFIMVSLSSATVVLKASNGTLSFEDIEANFGKPLIPLFKRFVLSFGFDLILSYLGSQSSYYMIHLD